MAVTCVVQVKVNIFLKNIRFHFLILSNQFLVRSLEDRHGKPPTFLGCRKRIWSSERQEHILPLFIWSFEKQKGFFDSPKDCNPRHLNPRAAWSYSSPSFCRYSPLCRRYSPLFRRYSPLFRRYSAAMLPVFAAILSLFCCYFMVICRY